jgi:ribosome-associated protein
MKSIPNPHEKLIDECVFKASRSGGAGGQNVNKVSTKIELSFSIEASSLLSDLEKENLTTKLSSKINKEGVLLVVSQTERTQLGNKTKAIKKFLELIAMSFEEKKIRKETKIPLSVSEKRRELKKRTAILKESRKFRLE